MAHTYFITGATGCIGSWIVKTLIERGDAVIAFDLSDDAARLHNIMLAEDVARVRFIKGDIGEAAHVSRALSAADAPRIIHLAGVQVPTCRANPILGAHINVIGTLNVFEAALAHNIKAVVYASSAAVFGMSEDDRAVDETVKLEPATHYGVFKQANEANARIYFQDRNLSSVGLRPLTVYGVNRDTGLTSDPTKAMKAAVVNRPFHIRFSGKTDFQYVKDTAHAFIRCADADITGAHVFNLHGSTVDVQEIIELINAHLPPAKRHLISHSGAPLPIAPRMDDSAIRRVIGELPVTSLADGINETLTRFQDLQAAAKLDARDLDV